MSWTSLLKKKKYMPFIPVIKAVEKENIFTIGNLSFSQTLGGELPTLQKDYVEWRTTTQGLSKDGIGVVGRGAKALPKEYRDTLFEHVQAHVNAAVKRPGQKSRKGAEKLIVLLENIITDENSPITDRQYDTIDRLTEIIRKMGEEGSDLNPKNIPFTEPEDLSPPKQEGEKWGKIGSKKVRGHYRTPMYQKTRQRVYQDANAPKPVPPEWYSYADPSDAKPPFWQALFAKSSISKEAGNEVTMGILGILERLEKALDDATLGQVEIKDVRWANNKKYIDALASSTELVERLKKALKNQANYSGGTRKVSRAALLRIVNEEPFTDKEWAGKKYLGLGTLITEQDIKDMPVGWDNIERYSLKLSIRTIDNVINQAIRGTQMMAPNGKPYWLPSDTGAKLRKYPWYSKYAEAEKPVKKSWIDMLWG
jgi:hypothetical protein